ncbi:zinc finger protein 32-like, partial [Trichogramma pretiosum]|uniref:zinc finger protein 32-like n=1 Tax=Trichogramma pretiosum TaxID=7493 RepID=UPI0006C9844B
MESRKDTVRIKDELNDIGLDAGDDYKFDVVDFLEVKNVKTFSFYKSSANHTNENIALQEMFDEKIFVDFECKYVKPELRSLSTKICKFEYESYLPDVKIENKIQTSYFERSLIILIRKNFDYYNNCQFQINPRLNFKEYKKVKIVRKASQTKLSNEYKMRSITDKEKANLKTHVNTTHKSIRRHECAICHKSFGRKNRLNIHIKVIHDRNKSFECKICHESFGENGNLKKHIRTVHDRIKPFECEICHESFGEKGNLKRHIRTVHYRSKPFECNICRKSFGEKGTLKRHVNQVHGHSKPFECDICHKSFGYKNH